MSQHHIITHNHHTAPQVMCHPTCHISFASGMPPVFELFGDVPPGRNFCVYLNMPTFQNLQQWVFPSQNTVFVKKWNSRVLKSQKNSPQAPGPATPGLRGAAPPHPPPNTGANITHRHLAYVNQGRQMSRHDMTLKFIGV